MNPPIEITGLSLCFKDRKLFENVNLTVAAGEFVTIMGENGSGKTSLIETMLGLHDPACGSIRFWGTSLRNLSRGSLNLKTGWVLSYKEDYPPGLTVGAFLSAVAQLYPSWDKDLQKKLLTDFQLDRGKQLAHLSLGENSKVKLIKALCFKPELIILDELTANLSEDSRVAIVSSLIHLFSDKQIAVLYLSHSREEALRLSDRVFYLTQNGLRERQ